MLAATECRRSKGGGGTVSSTGNTRPLAGAELEHPIVAQRIAAVGVFVALGDLKNLLGQHIIHGIFNIERAMADSDRELHRPLNPADIGAHKQVFFYRKTHTEKYTPSRVYCCY